MICPYGMLFQLSLLPNLNPHHPQFITKSYGTSCLYVYTQATEAQLITFSEHLLHAHTIYNFGRTHKHKFRCLVSLSSCACILRDEFTKIYARSHTMSFIHVHILQHLKAIYIYGYRSIEEPVKAEQMRIFFRFFAACKHKRDKETYRRSSLFTLHFTPSETSKEQHSVQPSYQTQTNLQHTLTSKGGNATTFHEFTTIRLP